MARRPRRGEDGFAMITTMVFVVVAVVLASTILAAGVQLQTATFRDRLWHKALQVTESGIEYSVVQMSGATGDTYQGTCPSPCSSPGPANFVSVPGGEFMTTITVPDAGFRLIDSIGYVPNRTAANKVVRRVKALYGPGMAFRYALWSNSDMAIKNNANPIVGDAYANGNITIDLNTVLKGDVKSGGGWIDMLNGSKVLKDGFGLGGNVISGGLKPVNPDINVGVRLANLTQVETSVRTRRPDCAALPTTATSKYTVSNNGASIPKVVSIGNVTGPYGTWDKTTCEANGSENWPFQLTWAQAKPLFVEKYGAANVYEWPSKEAFETGYAALNPGNWKGVHHVDGGNENSSAAIQMQKITGDFVLWTKYAVKWPNNFDPGGDAYQGSAYDSSGKQRSVMIISTNNGMTETNPAVDIENQFQVSTTDAPKMPCMLIYSKGRVDIKNNGILNGALYGNPVVIKNNFTVQYDKCVRNTLGFSEVKFGRVAWTEVKAP